MAEAFPAEDLVSTTASLGTPIEEVPQLQPYARVLISLGYVTLEHLLFGMELVGTDLSKLLHTDMTTLVSSVPITPTAIPPDELEVLTQAEYSLGVAIESLPPDDAPPPPQGQATVAPGPAPAPNVNLIGELPPIRQQGRRGTCVAHAALAALEHAMTRGAQYEDMSEQFLYWNCKQNDGRPLGQGTRLEIAMPLLNRDGCCREATWAYNPAPITGNEGHAPAPDDALLEALDYRTMHKQLPATSVDDLKAELSQGRVVAFSIPTYKSWYGNVWVRYSGDIVLPVPDESHIGGHAMSLVGFVDMPDKPELGGGRFILRNSWGEDWGTGCPYGKGYGTIPYNYISKRCIEAYSISEIEGTGSV